MNNDIKREFERIMQVLPQIIKRLPAIVKVEGLSFIHDNFDREGFETKPGSVNKWKPRKPKKRKDKRHGRQLLVDTSALRRSWDADSSTTDTSAEFTSQLPYTGVHNDGLMSGRPPGFTMPERKMIGPSEALDARVEQKMDREFNKLFNK